MASFAASPQTSTQCVLDQLGQRVVELIQKQSVPVPAYPAVAAKLRAFLARPGYKVEDLTVLIASDQVVSASVLQVANSGLFAGLLQASSLRSAIARIGEQEVTRIAIAGSIGASSTIPGPLIDLRRRIWRRSLIAAHLAHGLARFFALPPDDMFMLALLHDFGSFLAIATIEKALAEAPPNFVADAETWDSMVGGHHVELGLLAAKRWSLPSVFADVIAMHHEPRPKGSYADAVRFIQHIDALTSVIDTAVALTPQAFEPLGLPVHVVQAATNAMPKILQTIASFEALPARPVRSAIARRATGLGLPASDVDVSASIIHGATRTPLQIIKAGPFGMLGFGRTRFANTQLMQFRLHVAPERAIDMCVTAQLAAEDNGGNYQYELTPFAQHQTVNREYVGWLRQVAA